MVLTTRRYRSTVPENSMNRPPTVLTDPKDPPVTSDQEELSAECWSFTVIDGVVPLTAWTCKQADPPAVVAAALSSEAEPALDMVSAARGNSTGPSSRPREVTNSVMMETASLTIESMV